MSAIKRKAGFHGVHEQAKEVPYQAVSSAGGFQHPDKKPKLERQDASVSAPFKNPVPVPIDLSCDEAIETETQSQSQEEIFGEDDGGNGLSRDDLEKLFREEVQGSDDDWPWVSI